MDCIWHNQKHDYANYDGFVPNFDVAYKTTTTKFEVIWTNENRVMGKRSWRIFYYVIWENGLVGVLLPTNMAAAIKMYNKNVWRFSKLWTAITLAFTGVSIWNLQRSFKMGLFTMCKNFVQKIVNLNFWWCHWKPWIVNFCSFILCAFWSDKGGDCCLF